jgi:TolB protein
MAVHRIADEVTRWADGTEGYASSRLLILSGDRIYQVDSDGADLVPVTPAGEKALSNAWAPDGRRFAYTRFSAGRGTIVVRDLAGGSRIAHGTDVDLNFSPAFSPDGRTLAFARAEESGATNIFVSNVAAGCCLQRLTVRNFADNLSPTYSPDGRRIAYVSSRAGPPQIYVMSADGTDQEVLAPFDYGATGPSFAPEWSPDGASVVFHREVSRSPQIFILDVASGRVKQLTSVGRNEDATWAPDGRHVAFISDRTGRRQVWVVDTETGRVRQISTAGSARLPSWSRRLGGSAGSNP